MDKGLDDKLNVVYDTPAAQAIYAQVKKERDDKAAQERADAAERERKEKEREAEEEAESARKADAEQKRLKQNLDKFTQKINDTNKAAGSRIVEKVQVEGDTATITVADSWHISPYQLRLQVAQDLWKLWASIASPDDLDKARIKLVDHNGNEVGGSGIFGGSDVWVQKD